MNHFGGPFSPERTNERVQRWIGHWKKYGYGTGIIQLKKTSEQVGGFAIFWTTVDKEDVIEIGWSVLSRFQRNGFALEAVRAGENYRGLS